MQPPFPDEETARRYADAVRGLLAHGGFERTGRAADAARWDLAHIRDYLDRVGQPDLRHTVHVAGSKGKGTTSIFIEAILRHAGKHTLLLTSPDLHQARERIAIDGRPLDAAVFADLAALLLADAATGGWSYFELLTVMGWLSGSDAHCDWQIVEVGLGGRLDTTNAMLRKEVAVVTAIDLEHTAILGDTIRAIAGEKAGIITGPCGVVAAPMNEQAFDVVRHRAEEQGATLHAVARECALRVAREHLHGQQIDLRTPVRTYRGLELAAPGRHLAENAATAVRAAECALEAVGEQLTEDAVRAGLRAARLPGRFEVLPRHPIVILDGLHTPLAARRFAETVRALKPPWPHVYVLGMLAGKDLAAITSAILTDRDEVVVTRPDSVRAAPMDELAAAVHESGASQLRIPGVAAALEQAIERAGPGGTVLVAGSLYTVAEAREALLGITGDRALGLR